MTKMKESNHDRSDVSEDRAYCDGSNQYAIVDHFIYGDEFCVGSLDDVRAFLRAYGNGGVFCRVRLFTLH